MIDKFYSTQEASRMLCVPKQARGQIKSRLSKSKRTRRNKSNSNLHNLFLGSVRFETDNLTPNAIEILARFIVNHTSQNSPKKKIKKQ